MKWLQRAPLNFVILSAMCYVLGGFALFSAWHTPQPSTTLIVSYYIPLLFFLFGGIFLSVALLIRQLVRENERLNRMLEEAAADAHRRLTAIAHRVDRLEGAPSPEVPELPDPPAWGMTAVPPSDLPG